MEGRINSCHSPGTLDGPGVRFVVFMQGCMLRCAYCHNPETWETGGGEIVSAGELFGRILRYRRYFGKFGGVTFSGGEPLLQADFIGEVIGLCRSAGIAAAIDTSGCVTCESARRTAAASDLILLDFKMMDNEKYQKYIGCEMGAAVEFLDYLESIKKPVWLRYVVIPGINDSPDEISALGKVARTHTCVERTELLPFRKLCLEKYEALGIKFPLSDVRHTSEEDILNLKKFLF